MLRIAVLGRYVQKKINLLLSVFNLRYIITPMSYKFKQTTGNPHFPEVMDVEPTEVLENATALKLIDVREADEFIGELGHVDTSELIILNTIPEKINSLPKDQTIIFICRSGGRSAQATAFAQSKGFTDVYNMRGGMLAWNHQQLPTRK